MAYLCNLASATVCVILHQVLSSVGELCNLASAMVIIFRFCAFCRRYCRRLAYLCHLALGMVISPHGCAILHQVRLSVGFASFCTRYGGQLVLFLHQVWLLIDVSVVR